MIDKDDQRLSGLRLAARERIVRTLEHLSSTGQLSREDICQIGVITRQQASADIREIERRLPGIMTYDRSRKRYVLTESGRHVLVASTTDATVPETKREQTDIIVLSVALESGRFKTEMRVPLFGSAESKQEAMEQWFELITTAFKIGATHMQADLGRRKP